jgi:tRNA threonylcarbamoyladenosine biosynthesis protein TsaB
MLVLAIDTATPAVTAGLVELPEHSGAPRLLAERVTVDAMAHAELLAPQIRDVLGAAPAPPDAIVCGAGPGPFTGLRVGMVTAAALGDGLGVPVHGVCSLDAIASAACGGAPRDALGGTGTGLLVVTDARRREVYWAAYRGGARISGPHVQRPAELARLVPNLGVAAAAGAGAVLYAAVLGLPLLDAPYPTPTGLVAVAAADLRRSGPQPPLVPLYLRRPDAAEPGPRKPALSVSVPTPTQPR